MANILNAGTNGLTITGSSSAALNIQVGGTNALQIGTAATATLSTTTFPSGTASAPAIAITGDTDTGIYAPAANQLAVSAGGTVAAAFNSNGLFFRNRIINGDMRIDQRNSGAAVTTSSSYPVDRFFIANVTDGAFSAQRDTVAPTGFTNSLKFTTTTADTSLGTSQIIYACQIIEGFNTSDFNWGTANAQTVTLSFWTRSSLTGTFGGTLRNAGSGSFRAYPFTYTISAANTWEYKTVTIAGDTTGTWATDNTAGIYVFFGLGVGTSFSGTAGAWASSNLVSATGATSVIGTLNATWYITGVQLETGSVATPFERRPYGTELMLCQRYYERLGAPYFLTVPNTTYTSNVAGAFQFVVEKRATPTLSAISGVTLTNALDQFGLAIVTVTSPAADNISQYGCRTYYTLPSAYTAGEQFIFIKTYYQASAEL